MPRWRSFSCRAESGALSAHDLPKKVWVDTDLALGGLRGDVDDGFALAGILGAARLRKIRFCGVSTVFGNTSAAQARALAEKLGECAGVAVSAVGGAETPGEETEAAHRIAGLDSGAFLLALGPLTNVAAACRLDPSLASRVCLRIVGGNLSSSGFWPPLWPFEFNLTRDRSAARAVLARRWQDLVLYPLDVVRRFRCGERQLGELAAMGPLGTYVAEQSRRWLARARRWRFSRSFPLWDLPAALDAIGELSGKRETRPLSPATRRTLRTEEPVSCLVSFDADAAWRRFVTLVRC